MLVIEICSFGRYAGFIQGSPLVINASRKRCRHHRLLPFRTRIHGPAPGLSALYPYSSVHVRTILCFGKGQAWYRYYFLNSIPTDQQLLQTEKNE